MASNDIRKVRPGEQLKIPANAYNAFVDAARFARSREHTQNQASTDNQRESTIISVRNTSGEDIDRYGIMVLDGDVAIQPEDNEPSFLERPIYTAIIPDAEDRPPVVLLEPINDGSIGRAMIAGVTPIRLKVTAENDPFAAPVADDYTTLTTGASGSFRVLFSKDEGTGEGWGLVQFPFAAPSESFTTIEVGSGNELILFVDEQYYGLHSTYTPIEEVPTEFPEAGAGELPEGLSGGRNLATGDDAWVATMVRTQENGGDPIDHSELNSTIPEGIPVVCRKSFNLPIKDDPDGKTAVVWLPWIV